MAVAVDRKLSLEHQKRKFEACQRSETATSSDIFTEQLALAQEYSKLSDREAQKHSLDLLCGLERVLTIHHDLERLDELRPQSIVEFYRSFSRFYRLDQNPESATDKLFELKQYLEHLDDSHDAVTLRPFWEVVRAEEHFKIARSCKKGNYLSSTHDLEVYNLIEARQGYEFFLNRYDLGSRPSDSFQEKILLSYTRLATIHEELDNQTAAIDFATRASMAHAPAVFASQKRIGHHLLDTQLRLLSSTLEQSRALATLRGERRLIPNLEIMNIYSLVGNLSHQLHQLEQHGLMPCNSLKLCMTVLGFHRRSLADYIDPQDSPKQRSRLLQAYHQLSPVISGQLLDVKLGLSDNTDHYSPYVINILKNLSWLLGKVRKEHADPALELATWSVTRGLS
jgi:hypothetical protein